MFELADRFAAALEDEDLDRARRPGLPAPGKRTLTGSLKRLPTARPALQRVALAAAGDPDLMHAAAEHGVRDASATLPFHDTIQRAFGRHAIGHIGTRVGGEAAEAAAAMSAQAFAYGDRIGFASAPDLHTAAHEAAHVVQQRGGVQLAGGVGAAGDVYERHADEVADAVVAGHSAEALLDRFAGGAPAPAAVQRVQLERNAKGKLVKVPRGAKKQNVIDTALLGKDAVEQLILELQKDAGTNRDLIAEIRKEAPASKKLALDDLTQVFTLDAELDVLEKAKLAAPAVAVAADKVKAIAEKLAAAQVLLQSVEIPDDAAMYREAIAAYTRRLKVLAPAAKLDYGGALEVDVAITPADRLAYRADVLVSGVWGGLAEAEVAATRMRRRLTIMRIDSTGVAPTYRRVTAIGTGAAAAYNLLHLGNHYVALDAGIADGAAVAPGDDRIETEPDGNCMYEALYACQLGRKPYAHERARFITSMRAHVSGGLTDGAIDTSIVGLLSQGDRAGLGAGMKALVKDRHEDARIDTLDDAAVQKTLARLEALKPSKELTYKALSVEYLAARKVDPASADTRAKLEKFEQAVASAEMALAMQTGAVDPSQTVLPMDWWDLVKAALGDKLLNAKDDPLQALAQRVQKFNAAAHAGASIPAQLNAICDLETDFKGVDGPEGPLAEDSDAHRRARIAVHGFHNVSLRRTRANLIGLFQMMHPSGYRTGPGGRPEMHYDVYAAGEQVEVGQRATPMPSAYGSKEQAFIKSEFAPGKAKEQQEALSAVALMQRYPAKFSKITKAPKLGLDRDVEYYDNDGFPWDQVSAHSYTKGDDDCGPTLGVAVRDHLSSAKDYPKKGGTAKSPKVPSGVILDCTYLVRNDYERMWAWMIIHLPAEDLRTRVVEINVAFAADDRKADYSQGRGAATNMSMLDKCRLKKDSAPDDGRIYDVSIAELEKVIGGVTDEIAEIRAGRGRPNVDNPVFRNHGDHLPNMGSLFLEYYVAGGSMPAAAELRIVYDQPNNLIYISGTHYRPFMVPHSGAMRHPFYRVV